MVSEFEQDFHDHRRRVAQQMQHVIDELMACVAAHDLSKLSSSERPLYEEVTPLLKTLPYGSQAYQEAVETMGAALVHHYRENRHHPEHFENGVEGMNLVDVIEMVCDWLAASSRGGNDIRQSLSINKERFQIGDQLYALLQNTIDFLDQ